MNLTIEVAGIKFNIDPHGFVTGGGCGFHIEEASKTFKMRATVELSRLAITTKVTEIRQQAYRIMQLIPIETIE